MTKERRHDEKPWEPTLDTLPVFNPFVNPVEHLGDPQPEVHDDDAEAGTEVTSDPAGDASGQPAAVAEDGSPASTP